MTEEKNNEGDKEIPLIQKISSILWPSFITAGLANSIFFTFIDPQSLIYAGGFDEASNISIYSIGFFLFWMLTSSSCLMTSYFMKPCCKINPKDTSK